MSTATSGDTPEPPASSGDTPEPPATSGDTPEPPAMTVWFNPNCSKCRTVQGILSERGVDANYVRYLEQTPTRAEIEAVLTQLGTDDPRTIMRTGEAVYNELGLAGADRDALLDAMVANPILIERPIVIRGERAVVGRPPENVLDLL